MALKAISNNNNPDLSSTYKTWPVSGMGLHEEAPTWAAL
jgi:hypothetical protein